jgi:diguanylate cyclase (GGDEF)-like protein
MNNHVRKRVHFLLLLITFVLGSLYYQVEHKLLTQSALISLNSRTDIVNRYLNLLSVSEESVRSTAEYAFARRYWVSRLTEFDSLLKPYPSLGIKGIAFSELTNGSEVEIQGSLSAFTDVELDHPDTLSELKVILSLNSQLETIISDPLVNHVYYLSAKHFFYVLPELPFESYRIKPQMYESHFWTQALPENNPKRDTFVSPVYREEVSGTTMVTYVNPLDDLEDFAGVIAYDIDTQNLLSLVAEPLNVGQSYLLDATGQVVDVNDVMQPLSEVSQSAISNTHKAFDVNSSGYFYATPLIEDTKHQQLVFVHKISHKQLNLLAMKSSVKFWLVLLGLYVLTVTALRKHATAQASQRLMMIDPLTGVLNRRGFENQIRPSLDKAQYDGENYAILLIDIDHFKRINDEYGHDVGDEILKLVALQLQGSLRGDCELARWGGEEFIVFVPHVDGALVEKIGHRLRKAVSTHQDSHTSHIVSVSVGGSIGMQANDLEGCIKRADTALYKAKQQGRDQVVVV